MKSIDYSAVIERMKIIKKFKSDSLLADYLKVSRQAIHGFKQNKVPLEMLISFCETENVSFDWLVLGRKDPGELQLDIDNLKDKIVDLEEKIEDLEDKISLYKQLERERDRRKRD